MKKKLLQKEIIYYDNLIIKHGEIIDNLLFELGEIDENAVTEVLSYLEVET